MSAIDIDHLTKRYGETVAVDDLSFKVEPGRLVGFLGPNGAGKTTTLRALLGLIRPTDGTATVEGSPFGALEDPAHTVGAVLDGGMLHPSRSGRNHLRMLARAAGAKILSCYSNYTEALAIQCDRSADYALIGSESSLPKIVTKNGDGTLKRRLTFFIEEGAAESASASQK